MPDLAMHYYYGQDVLKSLPSEIPIDPDVFCFTLSGPDDWFFYFTDVRKCTRGSYMHRYRTGEFLHGLAKQPVLLSYFAGYFCHHMLDLTCHPYIIARTGFYERTRQTRQFRGNHTALERALDRWILDVHDNQGDHPLTDVMFKGPLPAALEEPLDQVYYDVFKWDQVFPDLLEAKRRMRKYLHILENPHGRAKIITEIVPHPLLKPLVYSQHYYEDADILNLAHKEWHHPKDPSMISTSSFPELVEQARHEAVKVITEVYHGNLDGIGNRSYLTGLDLGDKRNQSEASYTLLKRT